MNRPARSPSDGPAGVPEETASLSRRLYGYLALTRTWRVGTTVVLDLQMEPELVAPNPRIDSVRGCLAIQRGPLVYCLEGHDQPAGANVRGVSTLRGADTTRRN